MQSQKAEIKATSVFCLWLRSTPVFLKFTFLAEHHLLFQYLVHVGWLQIIHCHMLGRSVPSLSVQLHKYPWVLCAFRCEHQLFNRPGTWEVERKSLSSYIWQYFILANLIQTLVFGNKLFVYNFMVTWLLQMILCTSLQMRGSDVTHRVKQGTPQAGVSVRRTTAYLGHCFTLALLSSGNGHECV